MVRVRCSISGSNRLDGASNSWTRSAKSASVWRTTFMCAAKLENGDRKENQKGRSSGNLGINLLRQPQQSAFHATGNNERLSGDVAREAVRIQKNTCTRDVFRP